jgi:hypothetical protein
MQVEKRETLCWHTYIFKQTCAFQNSTTQAQAFLALQLLPFLLDE